MWLLRNSLTLIFMLSLVFLAACDGTKTTPGADALTDGIAADDDLITDDLIPDEEEPDEADIDTKTDTKPDPDKVEADTVDIDEVTDEVTDDDGLITGPCSPNPCEELAGSTGECTVDGDTFICGCEENYTWDAEGKECAVDTRRTDCANIPANAHGTGDNADGKYEQTWDGEAWLPASVVCTWECDNNFSLNTNEDACVADTRRTDCTNIPDNAHGVNTNADGKFQQIWDGDSWEPATGNCTWVCDDNYTVNIEGTACVANTKRVDCINTIPDNAVYGGANADGKFEQTWDGGDWAPATFDCAWVCANNYKLNEDEDGCVGDERRVDCTTPVLIDHAHYSGANDDGKFAQTWDGSIWAPAVFLCEWDCNENYTLEEVGPTCVPDKRRTDCENLPANATYSGDNTDGKFEQEWDGSEWMPETFICAWECNEHYSLNEAEDGCEPDTQRADCTNIPANAHGLNLNEDKKFEQTWDGDSWEPATFVCEWDCDYQYLLNEGTETCDLRPVVYVNHAATDGANTGYSWEDAFTDLSEAIDLAVSGQEIWVAAGTYTPTICATSMPETCDERPRGRNFTLKSGVGIYGGFAGGETLRDDRDWEVNETILSGDFDGNDVWNGSAWENREENAYHVIQVIWDDQADEDAILDGFTVTAGNADGTDVYGVESKGGGIDAGDNADSAGNPIVRNCVFRDNRAVGGGGGASFMNMDPTIEDCEFTDNHAGHLGGGLALSYANAQVTNCVFEGNFSEEGGGALAVSNASTLALSDVAFRDNEAVKGGSAVTAHGSDLTIFNGYFEANTVSTAAEPQGGALSVGFGDLTMTYATFYQNHSVAGVSALSVSNGTATIQYVEFIENSSSANSDQMETFEIREATLSLSDAIFLENYGTPLSINRTTASVERVNFIGNHGVNGGALTRSGDGTLTVDRCRFEGNAADQPGEGFAGIGGALFLSTMEATGTPVVIISNSVFHNNSANLWGGAAALIMISPSFVNCTFDGNTDMGGDAFVFGQSNAIFQNTILWDEIAQIVGPLGPFNFDPSVPVFTNSDVYQSGGSGNDCGPSADEYCWILPFGTDGGNNIDADPVFVGSGDNPLDLQATSPCIDAGSNALVPEGILYDILGDARIQAGPTGVVDMGAYEQ